VLVGVPVGAGAVDRTGGGDHRVGPGITLVGVGSGVVPGEGMLSAVRGGSAGIEVEEVAGDSTTATGAEGVALTETVAPAITGSVLSERCEINAAKATMSAERSTAIPTRSPLRCGCLLAVTTAPEPEAGENDDEVIDSASMFLRSRGRGVAPEDAREWDSMVRRIRSMLTST
jgi:hypothetical protein